MSQTLSSVQLEAVVVTARAGGKLGHRSKSGIGCLPVRVGRKTAGADGLIAIYLRQVRLVQGSRAHVLRAHAARVSELVLDAKAPLHKIRSTKFAIGHSGDRYWGQALGRIGLQRGA